MEWGTPQDYGEMTNMHERGRCGARWDNCGITSSHIDG